MSGDVSRERGQPGDTFGWGGRGREGGEGFGMMFSWILVAGGRLAVKRSGPRRALLWVRGLA